MEDIILLDPMEEPSPSAFKRLIRINLTDLCLAVLFVLPENLRRDIIRVLHSAGILLNATVTAVKICFQDFKSLEIHRGKHIGHHFDHVHLSVFFLLAGNQHCSSSWKSKSSPVLWICSGYCESVSVSTLLM